jgi:hypothetical protein
MLSSRERKRMSRGSAQRKNRTTKVTVGQLRRELRRLRSRVEDLEDLRDLNAAIERNAGKPGIPWAEVKKQIGV